MAIDIPNVLRAMMDVVPGKQNGLAERLSTAGKYGKVSQAQVSRWLRGQEPERPRFDRIVQVAKELGVLTDGASEDSAPSFDPDYSPMPRDGILEIDVRAGLGGGGSVDQSLVVQHGSHTDPIKSESWHFPSSFVRNELHRPEDRIRVIETYGDSMSPTIQSGDRVIIDTDHTLPSPDGLYAIRDRYGSIVVKRLQVLRRGDPPIIRIISDNKAHDTEDVGADEIAIVGRVLWGLKRL